jgi:predicted dehydrogenase
VLSPHRVALVGCGYVARVHLAALARVPEARVVAVCDPAVERAEELAARAPGASVHDSLAGMFAQARPDVVHVLTPVHTHAEAATAALRAGCHVLVEKPLASDAGECRELLAVARETRRTLGVDHNRLYDPVMQRALALLASGALGRLVGADAFQGFERGASGGPDADPGHWVHRLPGGILHNLAPHPAYLLEAIVGRALRVHAAHARPGVVTGSPVEEVRAVVEGERAVGTLALSISTRPFFTTLAIHGSEASAFLDFGTQALVVRRPPRGPKLVAKVWGNLEPSLQLAAETARVGLQVARRKLVLYPGMQALIRSFHRAVAEGTAPPVTGADGLANVELLDALWAAAHDAAPARRDEPERREPVGLAREARA